MLLLLEIGMLISGIIALAKGKFAFTKNQVVEGAAARVIGFVLLIPLPLAFAIGFLIGFSQAKNGNRVQPNVLQDALTLLELVIVLLCLVLALVISWLSVQNPATKRPLPGRSDEENDRSKDLPVAEAVWPDDRPAADLTEGAPSRFRWPSPTQSWATDDWESTPQKNRPIDITKSSRSSRTLLTVAVLAVLGFLFVGGIIAFYVARAQRTRPARQPIPAALIKPRHIPKENHPIPVVPMEPEQPWRANRRPPIAEALPHLERERLQAQKKTDLYEQPAPSKVPFDVDPKLKDATGKAFLSDLQEFATTAGPDGWSFDKNGKLGNSFIPDASIKVSGIVYPKGVSMHPPWRGYMRTCYALGKRAKTVAGAVALNDENGLVGPPTRFVVFGDGKVLWRSSSIGKRETSEKFAVDVSQVDVLELRTYTEDGLVTGAHAVWLDPCVTTK